MGIYVGDKRYAPYIGDKRRRYIGGGEKPNPYGGWMEGVRFSVQTFIEDEDFVCYRYWIYDIRYNRDIKLYSPNPNRDMNNTVTFVFKSPDLAPENFVYQSYYSKPNQGSVDYSDVLISANPRIVNPGIHKYSGIGVCVRKQYWSKSGVYDFTSHEWLYKGEECTWVPE